MLNLFKTLNLLSIDVAVGTMICALWFTRITAAGPRPYAITSLGLTVWIIYTCDHLLDAKRLKQTASTARHRFHQDHFKILIAFVCVATIINALMMFFIKVEVLLGGLCLAVVVVAYFKIQSHVRTIKELCGAVLYVAGILIPSLPQLTKPETSVTLLAIQFLLTALLNLILFSWFDYDNDIRDNRVSIVTTIGRKTGSQIIVALFILEALISIALVFVSTPFISTGISIAMPAVLLMLFVNKTYFTIDDRYRYIGDGIFFIPAIYMIVS